MNRLQQAMLINARFDHLFATELTDVTEIMQFNVIYDALLEIDELIDAAESEELDEDARVRAYHNEFADDELDEETEYEITPEGQALIDAEYNTYLADKAGLLPYVDIESDFNDFSPSVGTFEGTSALHDILPDAWRKFESRIDREVVADPTINRPVMRAPRGERAYATSLGRPAFSAAKTIGEAFTPCLGGAEYAGDL